LQERSHSTDSYDDSLKLSLSLEKIKQNRCHHLLVFHSWVGPELTDCTFPQRTGYIAADSLLIHPPNVQALKDQGGKEYLLVMVFRFVNMA
jgi:hypothetical protein